MGEHFDAVVIGMGPGGEVAASQLLEAGKRVAVVERELIGGECAYWACIPTKTLLRAGEVLGAASQVPGTRAAAADWPAAARWRDTMVRDLDDHRQREGYREQGAAVRHGAASIVAPGEVAIGDERLTCDHIVIATGSEAVVPPIEGLDEAQVWTNREVTTAAEPPRRAVVIGGGPVGCEVAQFLCRFGSEVTLVERSATLLSREDPRVGRLLAEQLAESGVDVRLETAVERVRRDGEASTVVFDDGSRTVCDVVVAASGRRPRTAGLGLENAGIDLEPGGPIEVDAHCRAAEGVWAVGDVTGVMPFTHVAKYQGRIAVEAILGRARAAVYEGVPRVVFTEPEVAAVGLTETQARDRGLNVATSEIDLTAALARPWTYEPSPVGRLGLVADADREVLVGAWALAPLSAEWIHYAALAVRAAVPVSVLRDLIAQFPTFAEGFTTAVAALDLD